MKTIMPYCLPCLDNEEIEAAAQVLRSGWLTMGDKTLQLEKELAAYVGAEYAVVVNSCTGALHLSLVALDIGEGDEVITTPFTFAATANVVVHTGARPVFADIDLATYNIDPELIEKAITPKTKAIIPVHYAGLPCDMVSIMALAMMKDLYVVEDAAHAIGCESIGFGDTACFSFYATKNMTTGEGGAVTTNDRELADRIRKLRLHGMSHDAWARYSEHGSWYYEIEECGWKYSITDIQSAIGLVQLRKLNGFIETRRKYAQMYDEAFQDLPELITPFKSSDHVYHLYPLLVIKHGRNEFIKKLENEGIKTSVHFIPLHLHPFYQKTYGYKRGDFPSSEWVYDREVSLPLYPSMTEDDVQRVITAVRKTICG